MMSKQQAKTQVLKSTIRPWDLPHINTNTANYRIYYYAGQIIL